MSRVTTVQLGDLLLSHQPGFACGARAVDGVRQLRMNNVTTSGELDWSEFIRVPAQLIQVQRYALTEGDIVFCNTNSVELVGKSAVVTSVDEPTIYSNHFNRLRVDLTRTTPEWVALALRRAFTSGYFAEVCTRWIGQASVRMDKVKTLEVPLPLLDEQQWIVKELEAKRNQVAKLRQNIEQQMNEIENAKGILLRDLFSGSDCKTTKLGDVLQHQAEGVGKAWADFPVYGATRRGIAFAKDKVGKHGNRYKPVVEDTIFYNPMRILLGSIAILPKGGIPGITSPDYVVVNSNTEILDSLVFYEWFRSAYGAKMILDLARGAVRERILFSRLCKGTIALPPIRKQQRVSLALGMANETLAKLRATALCIAELDNAILREAFA